MTIIIRYPIKLIPMDQFPFPVMVAISYTSGKKRKVMVMKSVGTKFMIYVSKGLFTLDVHVYSL